MIRTGKREVGWTTAAPVMISPAPARARSSWKATSRSVTCPPSINPVPIGGWTTRFRIATPPISPGAKRCGYGSVPSLDIYLN